MENRTNTNTSESGNMSVSAVVWFTHPDAESEKKTIYYIN